MNVRTVLLLAGFWTLVMPALIAQAPLPLFASDSIIELTLKGDLHAVIRDRGEERSYHKCQLFLKQPGGDSILFPIKIKVRGNFRRRRSTCPFPPLRFNFDKDELGGTLFDGQNKIKLVTHCRGRNQAFEQKLYQEYLVYRSYNKITDESFRVRLIRITYINTGRRPYVEYHHGFLIEDDDHVVDRMGGGVKIEGGNVHPLKADPVSANRVALFQYMIGNTDWSISGQHNLKLVLTTPGTPPKIIPYDFDWSGIVMAPYAEPNPILELTSVRERKFRGFCRPEETWTPVWEEFMQAKPDILALYQEFPLLEEREREQAIEYIENFYEIIEDPGKRAWEIEKQCRINK